MYRRLTAQLVMLCVHGHHAGLADCWDYMGDSPLIRSLRENEDAVHAEEAITWFLQNVADGAELDDLFDKSCQEIAALFPDFSEDSPRQASMAGLLGRLLLSMLADALHMARIRWRCLNGPIGGRCCTRLSAIVQSIWMEKGRSTAFVRIYRIHAMKRQHRHREFIRCPFRRAAAKHMPAFAMRFDMRR